MAEQIVAVEEVLLTVAHPELYRANAFRITELFVDAEARDISRRQATIKQATTTGLPIPPGAGCILSLAGASDPDAFNEAISHLGDPERRLVDELFWFWPRHFGKSRDDEALALLARGEISAALEYWRKREQDVDDEGTALHNLAILSHLSALDLEHEALTRTLSEQEQSERDSWWKEAFKYWRLPQDNEAFWSQMSARIRA